MGRFEVMKILVNGKNGFIGNNLVNCLFSLGHEIVCLDDDKYKGIDAVVHLSAIAGIRPELQDASMHYKVNVLETVDLLEFCVQYRIPKFIFISSSSVYGDNGNRPSLETDPTDSPLCHYAATKKAGELACYTYNYMYGINTTCLRLFTVYGPGQRTEMAIPLFTRLIKQEKEINIFGNGYRDYVYVDDVVDSIIRSINLGGGYQIYNIGSSQKTTIPELIGYLEKIIGIDAIIKYQSNPIGYVQSTWANIKKAREELQYNPQVMIQEGLYKYIDWYLKRPDNIF